MEILVDEEDDTMEILVDSDAAPMTGQAEDPEPLTQEFPALVLYDAMCVAIANCHEVDEVKDFRDKAIAFEAYARQAKDFNQIWRPGDPAARRVPLRPAPPRNGDEQGCR
jgi:hypothetical protein